MSLLKYYSEKDLLDKRSNLNDAHTAAKKAVMPARWAAFKSTAGAVTTLMTTDGSEPDGEIKLFQTFMQAGEAMIVAYGKTMEERAAAGSLSGFKEQLTQELPDIAQALGIIPPATPDQQKDVKEGAPRQSPGLNYNI